MLKRFSLLLALLYTIALTVLSLINLKVIEEVEISFADKIFHFLAYALLCLLWYFVFFYKLSRALKSAIVNAVVFCVVFGIIIEILQGTLTSYRALDFFDAIANAFGAVLTAIVLLIKNKLEVKN